MLHYASRKHLTDSNRNPNQVTKEKLACADGRQCYLEIRVGCRSGLGEREMVKGWEGTEGVFNHQFNDSFKLK